ncbi:unnamed protein product [Lactuca saligna]|uniref:Uncharacterized protein n=1 Tax=Lactuca saligna TaxID=75948 RepID=A0AA36E7R1_LACSI|nr:unnamed protein product [Lactuca saligna]
MKCLYIQNHIQSILTNTKLFFYEDLEGLKQLQALHEQIVKEAKELKEEVVDASMSHHASAVKELKGVSQQYHSLKSQYTEKVSQLEMAYLIKDVSIKLLEEELAMEKLLML